MNDAARRSIRTLVQGLPAGAAAVFLVRGWQLFMPPALHFSQEQAVWVTTALTVALTAFTSFLQNYTEARTNSGFLKTPDEKAVAREELEPVKPMQEQW